MFRSLILIASVIAAARAYSHGAPEAVCISLKPKHPAEPQTGPAPFQISINKGIVHPGEEVKVTLEGINGTTYKGFLLEALDMEEKIVGKFVLDPNDSDVKTLNCPDGEENAVTHRNANEKSSHSFIWSIRKSELKGLEKVVVFKATVAQEALIYWLALTSPKVTVLN